MQMLDKKSRVWPKLSANVASLLLFLLSRFEFFFPDILHEAELFELCATTFNHMVSQSAPHTVSVDLDMMINHFLLISGTSYVRALGLNE